MKVLRDLCDGLGPQLIENGVAPLSDEEIARRRAIRDAKRVPIVHPRDALLDLVVSRLLDAGTLEADAVVATGAPVSSVVTEKLQLFAKSQPAKVE